MDICSHIMILEKVVIVKLVTSQLYTPVELLIDACTTIVTSTWRQCLFPRLVYYRPLETGFWTDWAKISFTVILCSLTEKHITHHFPWSFFEIVYVVYNCLMMIYKSF